jgi:hypothetical protein
VYYNTAAELEALISLVFSIAAEPVEPDFGSQTSQNG